MPDVAGIAAGKDWKIFLMGRGVLDGGTSAVAPLWASLIVLINQIRTEAGMASLGFLNERLYRLAAERELFNDITIGDNRCQQDYPGYDARAGFDACTGWGTPIGRRLVDALVSLE